MTAVPHQVAPATHFFRGAAPDQHQARRAATISALAAGLSGRALDYGAGWGDLTARLAPQFTEIVGVDVDAARVAFAALEYAPIRFLQCAPEHLAFSDSEFDVVISSVVLHFVPSAEAYLAECRRALRPGGHLVIMIQSPQSMWMVARRWRTGALRRQSWGGSTVDEFRAWLEQAGFSVEAQAGFYDPPLDRIRNAGDIVIAVMNLFGHLLQVRRYASYVGFRCRRAP